MSQTQKIRSILGDAAADYIESLESRIASLEAASTKKPATADPVQQSGFQSKSTVKNGK